MKRGCLQIQSSIEECRKAIDYLKEAGEISSTTVMLTGEVDRCPGVQPNELPEFQGHQLILLDDNTLACEECGRRFESGHQELTIKERILFQSLSPKRPFDSPIVLETKIS